MTNTKYVKRNYRTNKPFKVLDEEAEYWDTYDTTSEIAEETLIGYHQANKTDTLTILFCEDIVKLRRRPHNRGLVQARFPGCW